MALEGLPRESPIVNPMAKVILSLRVDDQMHTQLKSDLPPRETAKILISTAFDLIFGYAEACADANQTKLSG